MQNKANTSRSFLQSAIVVALLSLSACATTGGPNDANNKPDIAKYATVTSHEAVSSIESTFQTTDVNDLAFYAPDHYSTAGKAIEDAKELLAKSQPREKIVQKVAVAEAMLRNGDKVMRKVKDMLEPEISIKEKLDSLNARSTYTSEYGSLNERLNKIIREIENGNTADQQNREKLLKDMQKLERKSIRFNAMNEPQEILKRVKYRGGEQLAPITYGEALAVFKRAEEFIKQNPDYEVGIAQMGREALFAAKRALYITEGVSALKQKVAFAPEQVILDEEYRMYRVARQLADLDYRDNSLEVQSELLAKEAESIALELKNKDDLVIALRDTLIKVRDSSSRLTMLSESTQRLKQEKNAWLAKEALFKAKVVQLEESLKKTEIQLDGTQQKLLAIKLDNDKLAAKAKLDQQNQLTLKTELAQLKAGKQSTPVAVPAPSIASETVSPTSDIQQAAVEETKPEAQPEVITETVVVTAPAKPSPEQTAEEKITEIVKPTPTKIPAEIIVEKAAETAPAVAEVAEVAEVAAKAEHENNKAVNSSAATEQVEVDPQPVKEVQVVAKTTETTKPENDVSDNKITDDQIAENVDTKSVENTDNAQPAIATTDTNVEKAPAVTHTAEPTITELKKNALAILAKENNPPKVSEQETLDALKSAKELIKSLKETEIKLVGEPETRNLPEKADTADGFLEQDEGDVFVDASD